MRNHRLYELAIYLGKKMLFHFRDSLNLLPGKLDTLAKSLSPGLRVKGSIPYDEVTLSNLVSMRKRLLDYIKQDILLFGGVMQKAQEIYWKLYTVDIESKITLSSLALNIFRMKYYDASNWPIHIPNKNEDTFIRCTYYGGHTDTYKPYGEDLYYYNVNSLYPFVMKDFPMLGGALVWQGNLEGKDLDSVFSFIKAYVIFCDENRYKHLIRHSELIFDDLLGENNYIVAYHSNTRIDSNYWNPPKNSTVQLAVVITAVARIYMYPYISREDCYYMDTDSVVLGQLLPEELICSCLSKELQYVHNIGYWIIPLLGYLFEKKNNSPFESFVFDTFERRQEAKRAGKFKLENNIKRGIFLARKSYSLLTQEDDGIIKHKGRVKSLVDKEWFESQYVDMSRTKLTSVESNFIIDWERLNVSKKETLVNLGIRIGNKRKLMYDNNLWVDTVPLDVTNFPGQENRI
ncbi:DNA polymerase-like [Olea europaea subsp. europaea]|uniref:DNA-directed DNA polymerase n=1 Tax=Olea europaea subsp. europaea TaxID=158383 RepID=A0A8S0PL75_OLEEU|nr:DNA polymerase-like [Olea europaea subsp. europaea]